MKKILIAFIALFTLSTVFIGCRDEKKEKDKTENSVSDKNTSLKKQLEDVGDAAKYEVKSGAEKATEKIKEEVEETAKDVEEGVDKAIEKTADGLNKAAKDIRETVED